MKNLKKLILAFAGMAASLLPAYSQITEEEIEAMMTREVDVVDPLYMPTIGIGTGYFGFFGNVNDAYRSYTVGKPGVRVNIATYLDRRKRLFRGNLFFMTGELSGTQRTVSDTSMYKNLNFKSDIISFGLNAHYSFKPWIRGKYFEPFISVGIEMVQFDSKADYTYSSEKLRYHYWKDGTIRDAPWSDDPNPIGNIISRDYIYETDLRKENQTKLGKNYNTFSVAIPVDVGIDFNVSSRFSLRAATSLHYAFTDLIDDMS